MRKINKNEGVSQEELTTLLSGDIGIESPTESFFNKIKQKIKEVKEKKIKKEYLDSLDLFDNDRR